MASTSSARRSWHSDHNSSLLMASTSSSTRSSRSDHNSSVLVASTSSSRRSSRSDHNSSILMASASSSMRSSRSDHTRFSVFLSFRGEDTRHSFTDHLYAALKRAAIHAFRDNDDIKRGRDLLPEIVNAIENSRASIVVLSENYAKSSWCLEELSLILEQKKNYDHFVLPVFYHVDPSDVRKQRCSFAIKASEEPEGEKWTEENVNRWKLALREVANMTGMIALGSETEFIARIVHKIDHELDLKLLSTPAHLTGMETRAKDINSWLRNEHSSTTNVLAICGMGGGGKTTLAQYIYNSNKLNFESSCFLEDIGKHFKTKGLLELQKQLLTDILGKEKIISGVSEGTTMINNALHMKKVLIVLDDINEFDELQNLLGTNSNYTQSKIIVTTRRLDIHLGFEYPSCRCHVHQIKLLDDHESLEVLSYHAFKSKLPSEGFWDLSVQTAKYCGGNPLALKVLGSSLNVGADDPRDRNSIEESWKSMLNSLCPVKGDVDQNIQSVLRKSFDFLPLDKYKELFLHIVVFFIGEDEDYVVKIMENDWHAKAGIRILINRCLLTVSPYKKLMIHQLLQDMGRKIIREEWKDHVRVRCNDEAYHVLIKEDVSETIEGLTLDARFIPKRTKVSSIKTSSLAKLRELKLLRLKYVKLVGDYKNIPDLRWLCWHGCHLKTIPSGLLMSTLLVAIDMTNGDLEKFEPPTELNSLKVLNLTSCYNLVSIRKFCRLPNLQTLILWCCSNLTHVCKTIEGLENLSLLNLAQCKALWKASWSKKLLNQPLFSFPHSLKFLFLDGGNPVYPLELCFSFNGPLCGISLSCNLFESIPSNIDLSVLRVLNLTSCKRLKSIMNLPSTLEELYTYNCISLEKVTFQSTRFSLRKFDYRGCFRLYEVQGLFKFVAIEDLDEADLRHMKGIKKYQDRIWHFQMLYEYGIRSTYLQGIKDQSMMAFEYTSAYDSLSFHVCLHQKKHKIQGLQVCCLYRLLGSEHKDRWPLFIQISNRSKDLTWIYNPMVYCKPKVDEDVAWLSYWPIGNTLEDGDEIYVHITVQRGMKVSKCGASLVYMDEGEVQQQENLENPRMKMEVIGGDLSEYQLTSGTYYLCRRDFFKSESPDEIQRWFGETFPYRELQGWRKSYQSQDLDTSCMLLNHVPERHRDTLYKRIWLGYFNKESDIRKIKKEVSSLVGVDFAIFFVSLLYTDKYILYVLGSVDSMAVEACVREFETTARIVNVNYKVNNLHKLYHNVVKGKINAFIKSKTEKLNSLVAKITDGGD